MRQGRLDDAAKGFAEVVSGAPTSRRRTLISASFGGAGKVRRSSGQFAEGLKLKPRLRGANLFLGIAEYRLNRFDSAIESIKKETAYFPPIRCLDVAGSCAIGR